MIEKGRLLFHTKPYFYRFTVLRAMWLFTSFWPAFEKVDAFPLQNFASVKRCALANQHNVFDNKPLCYR